MEYDGILRHYVHPESSLMSRSWSSLPTFIPSTVILIVSVLLSNLVFLNLLFLLAVFLLVFRFKYWKPKALKPYPVIPGMNLQSSTNEELTEATNGFREELGRGAFAKVYNRVTEYEDRKPVAVKRMNDMVKEGDLEAKAETQTTTGIRGTKGKSFEAEAQDEDRMILAHWAYDCYKEKKLDLLVENDEEAIDDVKRVENYVMIAIWCI
ncbi:hypothetical protein CMV_024085 [Castanea mollissima]|uniref:Protein kinase domain-containing protein n=1 Tax=Castanea mollissima TaxID=60419 RepID=A0A8J4QS28_9ROSI|nr:hypothetical protein CMV_024085 [Castanea mollissima]